jgi:hypothetical protein
VKLELLFATIGFFTACAGWVLRLAHSSQPVYAVIQIER